MDGYIRRSLTYSEVGSVTVVNLREEPLQNPLNAFVKRLFDIIVSFVFLCTLFPLVFVFVFIGTKLTSKGPIFFVQKRTGYRGQAFNMYKFRSMRVNDDSDKVQATADDPRKTKFGDFLRRTSIDELPQFINVLKGDMSVIGPRPHMLYHTEVYSKLVDEYLVRHMVKPGLTGWAQINGCRGETKTNEEMVERVRHDIWYIEHWSITLDLKIFFLTIIKSISGDEKAY
ncbi:MAG: exopolysaccharide biosynthesis polyprenyl glycosylphosphotransferase [Bacteroidales bacterium]|nr:exopolysaccharide biosynthesis polyprenyl glycosylphosphotransferase [Bacteroidales bacterium]